MIVNWELVGLIVLGIGMIATWQRNGKHAAKNYGSLETTVQEANKKLDTVIEKQDDIGKTQQVMQVHCAEVTSKYEQKIKGLEGVVFNLDCKQVYNGNDRRAHKH